VGIEIDTYTTVYTYDSKLAAAPLYLYPGIGTVSKNDVTQTIDTETGDNPGSVATTCTTTYNSANQPVSTKATVTTVPASPGIATENITYTYQ
jgi:hypothetical protein